MSTATSKPKRLSRAFPVNRRTPDSIRAAIADENMEALHAAWLRELAKPLKRLRKRNMPGTLLGMWSENAIELNGRERELAAALDELSESTAAAKHRRKRDESAFERILTSWLSEADSPAGPWELLIVAEILLREGRRLTAECFVRALVVLADSLIHERIGGLFEGSESLTGGDDPIRQMLLTGETPWIGSLVLSPVAGVDPLRKSSVHALHRALIDSSDAEGIPHGSVFPGLTDWLSPLVRAAFWADVFQIELWDDETSSRFTAVLERTTMLLMPRASDSRTSGPCGAPGLGDILETAIPLVSSPWENTLLRLIERSRKSAGAVRRPKKLKQKKRIRGTAEKSEKNRLLQTSWQSDSSCAAILRSTSEADSDLVTLEWHSGRAMLMLAAAGVRIFEGCWDWSVRVDGQEVSTPDTWKCSCWFLDPETIFVELEGEDSAAVKRVRQVLLVPQEHFAMLTDTVKATRPDQQLELTAAIPFAMPTTAEPDSVTRELRLQTANRSIRAVPVWLADDRIEHARGQLREADGRLELIAAGVGGVTMPLALDWHPGRAKAPADWNRLTVTEVRRVVSPGEATGHRVRIGKFQVLIYRSLTAGQSSRAVLGLHTWDESVYTRVPVGGGQLAPLVEVESPETA